MTPETQEGGLVGAMVGGYQPVALLGAGGMAEVYRARDLRTGREVALKVLPEALAQDLSYVQRFRDEAQRASALDHPNVVKVYYFGQDAGRYYLIMPVVPESLRDRMDRVGILTPLEAARIAIQVAAGLDAAHAQGLVHRDVKPENILLNEQGTAMLTDFGIAREIDVLRDATTSRTPAITGLPVGTPEYMAPEQLQGRVADHRMDVYGLGAVLYEMLTGRVPHEAETPMEVAVKALTEPTLPPSFFNRAITLELEQVILNALAQEQRDRYPNMRSFAAALRRAIMQRAVGSGPMAEVVAALGPAPTDQGTTTRRFNAPDPRPHPPMAGPPSARLFTPHELPSMGSLPAAPASGALMSKHPPRAVQPVAARGGLPSPPVGGRTSLHTVTEATNPVDMLPTALPELASSAKTGKEPRPHGVERRGRRISARIALATSVLVLAIVAFGGLAVTGNLAGVFGGPGTSLSIFFPSTRPTDTPASSSLVTVQPLSVDACHNGSFTIVYRGTASTVTWSATAPAGVTVNPSTGTLTPGEASPPIVVSSAQPTSGSVSVVLLHTTVSVSVHYGC